MQVYDTPADHRCVNLVLPGLLAPEALSLTSVETPFLSRCLSHATVSHRPTDSLEYVVLEWFNGESIRQNCAATLGYRLDITSAVSSDTVLRADPVYQQMDINHAVLADQSVLDLCDTEAHSLVETLNQHFVADGLVFRVAEATRWYCSFAMSLDIHTTSPGKATGRDVAQASPTGTDASRWRSWLSEIEMLLYSHPVNQQRLQTGKVPVNSLWLWGEGSLESLVSGDSQGALICSENFYTRSVAHHYGVEACELDDFASITSPHQRSALVVVDGLQRAAATADEQLRIDTLLELETKIFEPLWRNLRRGRWESACIWVGANKWLQLDRRARYKFWRKQKPLRSYIEDAGAATIDD